MYDVWGSALESGDDAAPVSYQPVDGNLFSLKKLSFHEDAVFGDVEVGGCGAVPVNDVMC